ncbi:RloB-like protein [Streptomyces zhaozhouensis]|uniref:RloB-like protein n=1 Tax=Streptomyces zhaozhouensis TaxID=1300267 RepID=A0A286DST2_9ACTN|nr:RloB family protein [Streptomyces zhaozhouensis]SOD61708.1 RloB-like protein [Streptomyces zhaozhouensis]
MAARPHRRRPRRAENERGLVVAEGTETERQYVERLTQHLRRANVTVRTVGVGKDPRAVVKKCVEVRREAARRGKGYDWCVCLVDRDEHTTLPAAAALARAEGIPLLVTNLKFEVWLLWHAVDVAAPKTSDQLDELVRRHGLLDGKHIPPRFPIEGLDDAVARARRADPGMAQGRVGPDPSSAVPLLVRLVLGREP